MGVKRAVVIGVDEYNDSEKIRPLRGARNDAREMYDLLAQDGDFRLDEPLVGTAATGDAIRGAMSELLWRTDPLDLALFYFSGHAFADTYGNGFLAPYDMVYDRPFERGIRMQELNDLVRKAVNKAVVLIILDACKSGIAAEGEKGPPEMPIEDAFDLDAGAEENGAKGRVVLASSGPDEKSIELPECRHQYLAGDAHPHGAFTYHVLEALSGGAASDDADVTLSALHAYVEREMKGKQHVTFFGSGVQNAHGIHLLRASSFATISKKISEAEKHLGIYRKSKTRDGNALFHAAYALVQVRQDTVSNERARKVQKQIDEYLIARRDTAIWYVLGKKPELGPDCPVTCQRLETLLPDISFDTLADASDMLGLLMTLWEASLSEDDDAPVHKTWRSQMMASEKHVREPAQVRTTKQPLGSGS
jgi:hypothetical protein